MEIITTHVNTDMDALASMVAAQKLYPEAVMVFPGTLSSSVEAFMALHKDTLDIKKVKNVRLELVERVILVDTRSPARLAELAAVLKKPGLEIHLFDHHPGAVDDLHGVVETVEMVGATTTLLVEKIRRRELRITPLEATIFCLGIYQDTGSLVYSATTPRDAEAVAYLLAQGANLSVVAEFLDRPFTEEQLVLLKELLASTQHIYVSGINLLLASGSATGFVGGLAGLTHKLAEFERPDAVFCVVEMGGRVYVVARSSVPEVSAREILRLLGGNGHDAAASVVIKNESLETVIGRLLEAIRSQVKPSLTAAAVMNKPVKTVTPQMAMEEAGKVMIRYGHNGLPVVDDNGQTVGIISRRDLEKATRHGLGHAPVKAFMTTNLVAVTPETPVTVLRDLMIAHDIGRLPVMENGTLLGIVTRTDILRSLHGSRLPAPLQGTKAGRTQVTAPVNIQELMNRNLSPQYLEVLKWAGAAARSLGYKVYAAGGIVRDLLLGMECSDLDLVVEGDGIALARLLSEERQGQLREHNHFGTAKVLFPDGTQVDLTTSRTEFYQYPAAMPEVESSSLSHDLYRRDFTINAMAVSLNQENFGMVIDFFGGKEDLELGLIRVLHNLSFVEDPVRMLRAVRFEKRYYMRLEPHTLSLAQDAINANMLARVSPARVWEELRHVFHEARPGQVLIRYMELYLWPALFPGVTAGKVLPVLGESARCVRVLRYWELGGPGEMWLAYFIMILHACDWDTALALCRRYKLNKRQTNRVAAALGGWHDLLQNLREPYTATMSELTWQVRLLPREAYPLVLAYLTNSATKKRFKAVLHAFTYNKPTVNGKDLQLLGYKPGPLYRKALTALWQVRLNGQIHTRQEELDYVKQYFLEFGGEEPKHV